MRAKSPISIVLAQFALLFFLFSSTQAQDKVKFGKVSIEELKDNTYPRDTTAEAVILYDKGEFNGNELNFSRHIRIKILKKSGTHWGNWTINTPSKGNIKAIVYNLVDGEVAEEKVSNSSIFEDEVIDDYYRYKIFAPNVKVGSIIDIKYYHPGLPFEWRFQQKIPVVYNELELQDSPYVNYSKTSFGYEPIKAISKNKWMVQDMPAFKEEPFLSDYSNYITKFQIQIVSIGIPGRTFYKEYSTSWENVNHILLDHSLFGGIFQNSAFLNDYAKELKDKNVSLNEKIALAYNYIRENIKWNESETILATEDFRGAFKKDHSGNCADINLFLVSLLKKADINADPVVLSTRDNGYLVPYHPSINALNYVVAYVDQGETKMLLDATSDDLVPGILPDYCINGSGLIVKEGAAKWVPLNNDHIKDKMQYIQIEVQEDGSATASLSQKYKDYGYLEWKEIHESSVDNQKYVKSLEEKYPNLIIKDYEIKDQDSAALSAQEHFDIDLSNSLVDLGEEVILTPFIMSDFRDNPFKSEERKYPVDLTYPSNYTCIVSIKVPESYEITSMPQPLKLANSDKSAFLAVQAQSVGHQIQLQMNLQVKKSIFTEMEYLELKQFYSYLIKKMNESIQFAKKS